MVLNELSVEAPAANIPAARDWMEGLVRTLRMATSLGVRPVLRVDHGLDGILVGPEYPIARWRNDLEVDFEARRFLRSLTSKSPCLSDIVDPDLLERVSGCDFRCEGQPAFGLSVAFVLQALAVSLRSDARWDTSNVRMIVTELEADGNISDAEVVVTHACTPDHVEAHAGWISDRVRKDITSGRALVADVGGLLPSLTFCDTALASLEALNGGSPLFGSTARRLFQLQDYCNDWTQGPFDAKRLASKTTPESAPTLARYAAERTFRCPDGAYRVFSWHVRLTPHNWRIHFHPDPPNRRLIVGYIGPKLPTIEYPT